MSRFTLLLAALLLAAVPGARAEVSVELNPAGLVVDLDISPSPWSGMYWEPFSDKPEGWILNRDGDTLGDLPASSGFIALPTMDPLKDRPSLGVRSSFTGGSPSPRQRRTALAVWPRFDGNDWELVYSLWDYQTGWWRPAAFVEAADNTVNDLEPRLFVRGHRVYLVWSTDEDGATIKLATASLVDSGGTYDLAWGVPATLDPELVASLQDAHLPLPQILGGGIGSSPLSESLDPKAGKD